MFSLFTHVWLFVTLWAVTLWAPLSMGFSQQECWSGLLCSPLGDRPHPKIEPTSPACPALQVDSLLLSHWRSPQKMDYSISTLLLDYAKESQLGNFALPLPPPTTHALEISSVNYHNSVFTFFSVNKDHGAQMTAVLSCVASLSPWVSLLGRLWMKNISKRW